MILTYLNEFIPHTSFLRGDHRVNKPKTQPIELTESEQKIILIFEFRKEIDLAVDMNSNLIGLKFQQFKKDNEISNREFDTISRGLACGRYAKLLRKYEFGFDFKG